MRLKNSVYPGFVYITEYHYSEDLKMAVPKKKKSKSRKRMHRSINMKMDLPQMTKCPECGGLTLPHRVCIHCGYYKGKLIVEVKKG